MPKNLPAYQKQPESHLAAQKGCVAGGQKTVCVPGPALGELTGSLGISVLF